MSADTGIDDGAVAGGLASRVPPPGPLSASAADADQHGALLRLAAEQHELCAGAVDEYEVAAGLEAAGLTDRIARARYGAEDVFDLAARLCRRVPRGAAQAVVPADPWRRPVWRHLLRGALYALPGLLYLLALRTIDAGAAAAVLLAGTTVSCALGQATSFLGHLLQGRGDQRACGRFLAAVLLAVALAGPGLSAAAGAWLHVGGRALLIAQAQTGYVLAATVLLVVGGEVVLAVVLAPGAALAAVVLTPLGQWAPATAASTAGALTVLAAVVLALHRAGRQAAIPGRSLRSALGTAELRGAAPYLVYGAVTAALLAFAVIDVVAGVAGVSGSQVGVGMLPLVLSLGIADWQLHAFRSRTRQALAATSSLARFAHAVRAELVRAHAAYAAALLLLSAAVLGVLRAAGRVDPATVVTTTTYALLGLALFASTILVSCGSIHAATACGIVALVADTAARRHFAAAPASLAASHLAVFGSLLAALLTLAGRRLGAVARHR